MLDDITAVDLWTKVSYVESKNRIEGVLVSVLTSISVDRWSEPLLGQTEDYASGICSSDKHTAQSGKSKGWLDHNRDNVSEWSDISTSGLLFQ